MPLKSGDVVTLGEKQTRDGCGFTDPSTRWSISPGQKKPLPKKISGALRATINSGAIVAAKKTPKNKSENDPDKKPGPETKSPRDENPDQAPDKEPDTKNEPPKVDESDQVPDVSDAPEGGEDEVKQDPDTKVDDPKTSVVDKLKDKLKPDKKDKNKKPVATGKR